MPFQTQVTRRCTPIKCKRAKQNVKTEFHDTKKKQSERMMYNNNLAKKVLYHDLKKKKSLYCKIIAQVDGL